MDENVEEGGQGMGIWAMGWATRTWRAKLCHATAFINSWGKWRARNKIAKGERKNNVGRVKATRAG